MRQQPFGRRATHRPISVAITPPGVNRSKPYSQSADALEHVGIGSDAIEARSLDDELREWKQARRRTFRLPWRQISFMASVCFGVSSLVLPDSVNRAIQWLLLALGALSLLAGFSARRKSPH
jgi:hypothetical protein